MILGTVLTLCACAASAAEKRTVVRLDARGVSASTVEIAWGTPLRFVNDDSQPHEIYSPDCSELSSSVLQPGDAFETVFGPGGRTCHFQDMFAPGAAAYTGTVEVADSREGVYGAP